MLVECAQDNEILLTPERHISFTVDHAALNTISEFSADPKLVQQAVNNLLDNAAKYSYPETDVFISAQRSSGEVLLTVTNYGLPIRPQEVSKCLEHGWRGEQAKMVTVGSGIGLWVVDSIMKAHKGSVLISPTTFEGQTKVHLVFPLNK